MLRESTIMGASDNERKEEPQRIALVGGGRWARVLCGVLLDLTAPHVRIDVHAPGRSADARDWIADRGAERVHLHDAWPDFRGRSRADAVIVANAPRDHARIATEALQAGIPTLVEKPLALSEDGARELVALAGARGVFLGVSRVFLFARYLEAFARQAAGCGPLTEARVVWADPRVETRHGAVKRFDPSVPVSSDVLPHVLPILRSILGEPAEFLQLHVTRGGMQTDLRLPVGRVPTLVTLSRQADVRSRIIVVKTASERLVLDFSDEPGRITVGDQERDGDPDWDVQPRPVARMLGSFLACAAGTTADDRLDAASAIEECRIADRVLQAYHAAQLEWLTTRIGYPIDEEIRYAIVERLSLAGPVTSRGDTEPLVARVWADMTRTGVGPVLDSLRAAATRYPQANGGS